MSKPQGGGSFFETIARFVVDRRNLIFFLYIVAAIFSVISSRWVGVNNDITDYLSKDTETRKGLTLMDDEMTTFGTARIMVSHVTYDIAYDLAGQIEGIDGVSSAKLGDNDPADPPDEDDDAEPDTPEDIADYMQGANALITVTFDGEEDDDSAKAAMQALIENGYAHGLLAGNALATHDLEASYLGTALGQDIYTQKSMPNGHYNHIDTINEVRRLGSIQAFVESGQVRNGIMYECVRHQVPFVLVGSVRDDGPLPEVYGDVYQGQDAMRELVRKATTIICMASTLHTVATGNMTPCYRVVDGQVRPLFFYSVDISEFAVNKLRDRGSLSVKTIVTNVQDFIVHVRKGVCPPEG